jgi:splicing factor 3B subunit 2
VNASSSSPPAAPSAMEVDREVENVEFEVIPEQLDLSSENESMKAFKEIFEKFQMKGAVKDENELQTTGENVESGEQQDGMGIEEGGDEEETEEGQMNSMALSRKRKKLLSRLSIVELKQLVNRPQVVEFHDVTAKDPRLLVFLKSYHSTVPVPRHWLAKRKYLQGKRGIEKAPFKLPDFIAATGIQKIRDSYLDVDEKKKLKQKQRDALHGRTGKVDIDYEILHDAFFKYQTKPKLTPFGDLYYEGKEFETDFSDRKPGRLSDALREALDMPKDETAPPIWLFEMQRYGLPPSYPHLRIPGVNAPIPPGAQYGFQPGGWGDPPRDQHGNPLFSDSSEGEDGIAYCRKEVMLWGELEEEDGEEEEEEDDDDEDEEGEGEEEGDRKGQMEEEVGEGHIASSGFSSVVSGVETPATFDIRKPRPMPSSSGVSDLLGSQGAKGTKMKGIDVSLLPEDLSGVDQLSDIDPKKIQELYELEKDKERERQKQDGLHDMVAKEIQRREKKRLRDAEQRKEDPRDPKRFKQ